MPNTALITIRTLKTTINHLLMQGKPSLIEAATILGTSPRTLQRNISGMGESFSHLLDETRCDMACKLLRQTTPKINEIATILGYTDAGSFTRAFERWMGVAPLNYRNKFSRIKSEIISVTKE